MRRLRVLIVADGMRRKFVGEGDGAAVVVAFRTWLSSPDFWFPMCEGADELDVAAARLADGQDAPLPDPEAGDILDDPPAAPAPATPAPRTPLSESESAKLRKEVLGIIASGASYDPREIVRKLRPSYPDMSPAAIVPVLEHLAMSGSIRRIPVGEGILRYQITAKARARL